MSVDVLFLCLTACVKGSTCREFLLTGRAASVAAPRPVVTESLRTKIRKVFIPFRRSRTESVFSEPVESFFFRWWENPVSASGNSNSPTDFPVALMGTAVSVGATFMSPACVRHCVPPFFIRACGNLRQRRGDIHVARVGAPLRCVCAVVSRRCMSYRSCAGRHKWRPYRVCHRAVVMPRRFFIRACGNRRVCHRAVVVSRRFFIRACGNRRQRRGDIHVARVRAPLRCVCVRHVRSVASLSPAWAPSCLVGVCLSASVPGVINGAPTGWLSCVRGKAGRFSIAGVRTPATGGVLTCVAARKTGRFPAWFVAVGTAPCGCGQGWCQSMRFT